MQSTQQRHNIYYMIHKALRLRLCEQAGRMVGEWISPSNRP